MTQDLRTGLGFAQTPNLGGTGLDANNPGLNPDQHPASAHAPVSAPIPAQAPDDSAAEPDDIYGGHRPQMEAALARLLGHVETLRDTMAHEGDNSFSPIEHVLARVKSPESMRDKCRRKGFPETTDSALNKIYDALGLRIVCSFLSDVYRVRDHIASDPNITVVEERDYILHAKPNGYRSYHMIVRAPAPEQVPAALDGRDSGAPIDSYYAEVQIRTISMDTWAALEHQLQYKKTRTGSNQRLIVGELKRCADELASTDVSMQTLRDLILGEGE